jgi:hypothetical protein
MAVHKEPGEGTRPNTNGGTAKQRALSDAASNKKRKATAKAKKAAFSTSATMARKTVAAKKVTRRCK